MPECSLPSPTPEVKSMTCRKAPSKEVAIDFTTQQQWWDIEVVYDGAPGWAMAAGNSPAEAEENFRS